jgi:hypothetical protein
MSLLAGVSALALPKTRAPEPLPEVELVEA